MSGKVKITVENVKSDEKFMRARAKLEYPDMEIHTFSGDIPLSIPVDKPVSELRRKALEIFKQHLTDALEDVNSQLGKL